METGAIENNRRTGRSPKWTKRDNNQLSVLVKKNKKATVRTILDYSMKIKLIQCAWTLQGLN